jgi:multicomponent Na+:H+ antiporter subunit C
MEFLLALVIGILYGSGVFLLLRRNLLKFILALGLISNATHLLIFTSAGLTRGRPPLIPEGETTLVAPYADPLPQALILTAIVISFGLTAFAVLLVQRAHAALRTDDPDELRNTDHLAKTTPEKEERRITPPDHPAIGHQRVDHPTPGSKKGGSP